MQESRDDLNTVINNFNTNFEKITEHVNELKSNHGNLTKNVTKSPQRFLPLSSLINSPAHESLATHYLVSSMK